MQTSHIGAIGIDLGSQRSVIAVAKKGGVEVLANEGSHRETQNVIGFSERERFIGEQGALQMRSNFKNTINYFTRFLGLSGRPPFYNDEARWLTVATDQTPNGKTLFNVQYYGNKHQYTPEQVTASMLNKLKDIIAFNNINHAASNFVISVPAYYTEQERKSLLDACRIAELPVERLFNETTAIATSYGLFRKADLEAENPRYVAFVDFGHSKTSAFVGSFTKEKAQIVAQVNDRSFGARDLDWAVFEKYSAMFEDQSGGLRLKDSKKAMIRIFEAIEKQRKVLSANSDAPVNVEYLMEDVDFNHTYKREEYEDLIRPILQRFVTTLTYLADQISALKVTLHSVEIVGGATRIPLVQQIIQQVLKVETISKTLNASESIARGCAMMAAMRSPSFRVTEYHIEDSNFYPIRVGWLFNSTLEQQMKAQNMEVENASLTQYFPDKQRPVLFDYNSGIPSTKSFNLSRTDNIELTLFYDPAPQGFQSIIQQVRIPAVKPSHPEFHTKIRIKLNQNGLCNLEDVHLIEEYMEEVKVPKEKPATTNTTNTQAEPQKTEGEPMQVEQPASTEPEMEIKKKKKTQQTVVNCDVSNYYVATQKEIQQFFEVESTNINQDRLTHETYRQKNELEAYIYLMKDQLSGKLKDFVTADVTSKFTAELDKHYNWLYDEGVHAKKTEYASRLDQLKVFGEPIVRRYNDFSNTPEALQELERSVSQVDKFSQTTEEKYAHITSQERAKVTQECQNALIWAQQTRQKVLASDKTKAIEANPSEVQKYQADFLKRTEAIMSKPKPAPPKEESKPAAETQQQQQQPQEPPKMETE